MISQPLIKRTEEEIRHLTRPIFIHVKKEDLLSKGVFTLDGQTFNGKNYILANLQDTTDPNKKVKFKFDGATVVYRIASTGDKMVVAICFKSHEDEYTKKIGRKIAMEYVENLELFSDVLTLAYDDYKDRHAISFSFSGEHLRQEEAKSRGVELETITLHDCKFRDVATCVENMAISMINAMAIGSSRIIPRRNLRSAVEIDIIG